MHSSTNLLGEQGRPLLLLPSEACVEEAQSLCSAPPAPASVDSSLRDHTSGLRKPSSFPSIRACGSSITPPFLLDLACWMEAATSFHASHSDEATLCKAGSSGLVDAPYSSRPILLDTGFKLLAHAVMRQLPALSSSILDVLSTYMEMAPDRLINSVSLPHQGLPASRNSDVSRGAMCEEARTNLTLLHHAVMSGSMPVVHALLSWAMAHSVRPNWMTATGPLGVTPLHLATLLPSGGEAVRSLLGLPRPYGLDIAAAWLLCRSSSDGRTPADLGSAAGLPSSLSILAHDMLAKAAAEDVDAAAVFSSLAPAEEGAASGEATAVSSEAISGPAEGQPSFRAQAGGSIAALNRDSNEPPLPLGSTKPAYNPPSELSIGGSLVPPAAAGRLRRLRQLRQLWQLCRLLLLGFPDRSVEQRYAQFKVLHYYPCWLYAVCTLMIPIKDAKPRLCIL